ncbi:MAG: hypothetical protein KGJ62_08145 [Armatimonadetes bacterium]|nr:hypothetical protein [Armatimonadota bacterium]MDE2205247.1 hypothetical protein [Armatimonadota bacterium]
METRKPGGEKRQLPNRAWLITRLLLCVSAPVAAAAVASPPQPALNTVERRIIQNPYPPVSALARLKRGLRARDAEARLNQLVPLSARLAFSPGTGMGWAIPDEQYYAAMPAAARTIPLHWRSYPSVQFVNSELGGVRTVALHRSKGWDQWLLSDPRHSLHAVMSIDLHTRHVWFMEVRRQPNGSWRLTRSRDTCFTCHPGGPRIIRPMPGSVAGTSTLTAFNTRIMRIGPCGFGTAVTPAVTGRAVNNPGCIGCHNGAAEARLYQANDRVIRFKSRIDRTMPP